MDDILEFVTYQNEINKPKKPRKKMMIFILNIVAIGSFIGVGYGISAFKETTKTANDSIKLEETLQNIVNKEDSNNKPLLVESNKEQEKQDNKTNNKNTSTSNGNNPSKTIINAYQNSYELLKQINKDTIGYLKVNGTRVSLPIVQTKNNEYYLTHDFQKNYSSMGWAFADYRNDFKDLDQNTILYGHTYKDTTIFSSLTYTLNRYWFNNKKNHIIEFSIFDKDTKWQIFSVYTINKTNDYLKLNFTEKEATDFIKKIKKRSIYNFNVNVDKNDRILTLSTCYITDKQRLVIHAKKIS